MEIVEGTSGTRVIASESKRRAEYTPYNIEALPKTWLKTLFFGRIFQTKQKKRPPVWSSSQILSWLKDVVELPDVYIGVLERHSLLENAKELLSLNQTLIEQMGIPFSIAKALDSSIASVRNYIHVGPEKGSFGFHFVDSSPYPFPFNGKLERTNTVLLCLNMQEDFVGDDGFLARAGYDLSLLRQPIPFIQNLFKVAREKAIPIIHVREGHRPTLEDLTENKRWRMARQKLGVGKATSPSSQVLTRGSPGWQIIQQLSPLDNEIVIDKPGKSAFYSTDLDLILRNKGGQHFPNPVFPPTEKHSTFFQQNKFKTSFSVDSQLMSVSILQ